MGLLTEGPLLRHPSIKGPLLLHPTLSPQLEVRQVQADVENQMLLISSDSQKHRGQVAFLSVRSPHPAPVRSAHPARGPGFPSALHQDEGVLRAWSGWCGTRQTERIPGPPPDHDNRGSRAGLRDASLCTLPPPQKLIQATRNEVNSCFSEIMQEVKHLQMKVLDFVDKEEAAALGKLGSSIQQSHNRLLKLEGDSIWLRTLLANRSDQQFLQARPHLAPPPPQVLAITASTLPPPTGTPDRPRPWIK